MAASQCGIQCHQTKCHEIALTPTKIASKLHIADKEVVSNNLKRRLSLDGKNNLADKTDFEIDSRRGIKHHVTKVNSETSGKKNEATRDVAIRDVATREVDARDDSARDDSTRDDGTREDDARVNEDATQWAHDV